MKHLVTDRTDERMAGTPRVLLFGMRCAFTGPVLDALRAAPSIDLVATLLPGRTPEHDPIRDADVPLIDVPTRAHLAEPGFRAGLEEIAPDAIIVACFPWRLPRWLLDLPPRGCLNLHPSLLPDGRGPEPVFWAFRRGLAETGVTLHLMDERFDDGPIIAQARVAIPDGATIPALERSLAENGARMALDHLRDSPGRPQGIPQPAEGTGYAPLPREADLLVPTSWEAGIAARFIHAAIPVYGAIPVVVLATGQRLSVEEVIGVQIPGEDLHPVVADGNIARIRFAGGTLVCRILRDDRPMHFHT